MEKLKKMRGAKYFFIFIALLLFFSCSKKILFDQLNTSKNDLDTRIKNMDTIRADDPKSIIETLKKNINFLMGYPPEVYNDQEPTLYSIIQTNIKLLNRLIKQERNEINRHRKMLNELRKDKLLASSLNEEADACSLSNEIIKKLTEEKTQYVYLKNKLRMLEKMSSDLKSYAEFNKKIIGYNNGKHWTTNEIFEKEKNKQTKIQDNLKNCKRIYNSELKNIKNIKFTLISEFH